MSQHNTKHIRSIMREYGIKNHNTWTNKYPNQTTVKCYVGNDLKKLTKLNNTLVRNGYETQITYANRYSRALLMGIIARVNPERIAY